MKWPTLILLAALALPAQAGVFDDEEARARIEKLRTEMRAELDGLATRVDRAAKNQIDFANQSEGLKTDLAKLRGQLEVLLNDTEVAQKRQRDFYVDLDNRLRKLETTAPAAAADITPSGGQKPDSAQETREYEAALAAYKAGRYVEANRSMLAFIKDYPNSALLPNAYYWAASSHFNLTEYARAIELFGKVAATWPNDPKAPDALLAQGNTLNEIKDAKGAKKVLDDLIARYPDSSAAQIAKQRSKKK
jgi:tol-pal system protein YbgF